jgi:hypothetical protein
LYIVSRVRFSFPFTILVTCWGLTPSFGLLTLSTVAERIPFANNRFVSNTKSLYGLQSRISGVAITVEVSLQ